ncbi:hypothetical protein HK102_012241 [Quaeritorhiza haematococci]|nr:hypothetical protein HK102_012241 [Quaeritorhiza haematococci]
MAALKDVPGVLPVIPTRNNRVLLPGIVMRLQIGRRDTTALMDQLWSQYSKKANIIVGCIPVKPSAKSSPPPPSNTENEEEEEATKPGSSHKLLSRIGRDDGRKPLDPSELHTWGVAARVIHFVKNSANEARLTRASYVVTLEGICRFKVEKLVKTTPFFEAAVTSFAEPEINKDDTELAALIISLRKSGHELANVLAQLQLPSTVLNQLRQMLDSTAPGQLADLFTSMIDLSLEEKLQILETVDIKARVMTTLELLTRQIHVLKISQKLQSTVENKLGQKQREFFLRQQLDAIKKELGESDEDEDDEIADLTKRITDAKLPEEAMKAANRELQRLRKMHPSMAEYQVVRNYLEWLADVPWTTSTTDALDVDKARKQLDDDHYGLDRVKNRILEYLAVRKLKQDLKGPILCFLGPPGVGKTSLGKSIAQAMGRKFYRISLGGVRDEAEIRGHRRTYIGSLPGVIVQALRRTGVNNPVILLDEIDKLGRDFRGDPSSALLEVLDPEQNSTFSDHYLSVPVDLSKVLFIATANEADTIPQPLMDRMEVIQIPGYTFDEKLHIAKRHLLPKQTKMHGLQVDDVRVDDTILNKIAMGYTREAGVRNLEREIAAVCRSQAVEYADAKEKGVLTAYRADVTADKLTKILGPERFADEVAERASIPGVVTGLAWTASGAGGLLFIEATHMPGKGRLQLTGKLGDVIKESAQICLTWVRSNASKLGISKAASVHLLDNLDLHIHFPAGAIPKDGPSAGVTIVTALVSLFSGKPVRDHTAMTGEITLRGQVLPVGGIKEKILAAHRGGIRRVILPHNNAKDLVDVPKNVANDVEFVFAKTVVDVLRAAFEDGDGLVQVLQREQDDWLEMLKGKETKDNPPLDPANSIVYARARL